ncbi:MAG: SMC family ATPase, partial [Oscillospiraceae bacterium]
MIPIKLELEAFGPFAKKQAIDFTAFDSEGIFLISGKTGSGKTSIFDAISFCLYGVASGDIRDADSFKSDFAGKECVCYVEFEFIVHGKRYLVRREPIQFKLKRNGNYVKENSTATLTMEDGSIVNGTATVDIKIEEILGINADQFKKIVMLPQGEFRKFLSDDSNEKQKTLRKIFSTKVLDDFTEQLRMNVTSLKSKLEQHITRCTAYIESIQFSKGDEIETAVHSENKDINYILRLLGKLNEDQSQQFSTHKESLVTLNQSKDSINIPYAKEVNSKFLLFENSKNELLLLNAKKSEFDSLSLSIELLKQIKEIESIEKSITEISIQETTTKETVTSYKKAYEDYSLQLDSAKIELTDAKAEQSKIPSMITKIEELKQKLTKIDKLNSLRQEFALQQDALKHIEELLLKLAKAQKYVLILGEIDTAQKQYDSFRKITSEILKCKGLTQTFVSVTKSYKYKMNCFIDSQAFFLSGSLKEDTPCPVCGSKEHPDPAKEHQETVSQDELESEKQIYDESSRRLKEQQTICNQLLINAEFDMKSHTKLSEFLPDIEDKTLTLHHIILELKLDLSALNLPSTINLTLDDINNRLNSQNTAFAVAKEKLVLVEKSINEIQSENFDFSDNPLAVKLDIQTLVALIEQT